MHRDTSGTITVPITGQCGWNMNGMMYSTEPDGIIRNLCIPTIFIGMYLRNLPLIPLDKAMYPMWLSGYSIVLNKIFR